MLCHCSDIVLFIKHSKKLLIVSTAIFLSNFLMTSFTSYRLFVGFWKSSVLPSHFNKLLYPPESMAALFQWVGFALSNPHTFSPPSPTSACFEFVRLIRWGRVCHNSSSYLNDSKNGLDGMRFVKVWVGTRMEHTCS